MPGKKQKISIVIKCRNSQNTIKLCLNSALNQSIPADEIIVVDDNSNDLTPEILKEYEKKGKIKVVTLKEQKGMARVFNEGLKKATGDIIISTNSDIMISSNCVERHIELHEKYDCVGSFDRIDIKKFKLQELLALPAYNASFSRKVLDKIGLFDEQWTNTMEDTEFFSRAKFAGFSVVNDYLIPSIHVHEKNFKDELKVNFRYGKELGKMIKTCPQGKLYSKWFLLFPVYSTKIVFTAGINFSKEVLMGFSELSGKIIGYVSGKK